MLGEQEKCSSFLGGYIFTFWIARKNADHNKQKRHGTTNANCRQPKWLAACFLLSFKLWWELLLITTCLEKYQCPGRGNTLTSDYWKKGSTQKARSGTRVFKTRVLNAKPYWRNMLRVWTKAMVLRQYHLFQKASENRALHKHRVLHKNIQKPPSCWTCASALCGVQDSSFMLFHALSMDNSGIDKATRMLREYEQGWVAFERQRWGFQ